MRRRVLRADEAARPSRALGRPAHGARRSRRCSPASGTRSSWPAICAATTGTATRSGSSGWPTSARRLAGGARAALPAAPAGAAAAASGSPTISTTRHRTGSGPSVSRALAIPYVVAEASVAGKQATGAWAAGHAASRAAIAQADLVLAMTGQGLAGSGRRWYASRHGCGRSHRFSTRARSSRPRGAVPQRGRGSAQHGAWTRRARGCSRWR